MRSRRGALRATATASVLVVALFAGSCSGDDAATNRTSTTVERTTASSSSTTTTTVDPAAQTEAEVVAAYEAASEAFLVAGAIPDPDLPALAATHADPMLNQRRGVLTQLKFEGRVIRVPEPSVGRIEAESFELRDPNIAVLSVCIVDDGERYDAASGELLTDGQPGTSRFEAALHQVGGRWVLAEQLLQEEWPGVAGCATD